MMRVMGSASEETSAVGVAWRGSAAVWGCWQAASNSKERQQSKRKRKGGVAFMVILCGSRGELSMRELSAGVRTICKWILFNAKSPRSEGAKGVV
jgi:hypothetical protein